MRINTRYEKIQKGYENSINSFKNNIPIEDIIFRIGEAKGIKVATLYGKEFLMAYNKCKDGKKLSVISSEMEEETGKDTQPQRVSSMLDKIEIEIKKSIYYSSNYELLDHDILLKKQRSKSILDLELLIERNINLYGQRLINEVLKRHIRKE